MASAAILGSCRTRGRFVVQRLISCGSKLSSPSLATRSVSSLNYPLKLASVSEDHAAIYQESLKNPEQFWGDLARRRLRWMKEFDQVMDCDMTEGRINWFKGGILNITGKFISPVCGWGGGVNLISFDRLAPSRFSS